MHVCSHAHLCIAVLLGQVGEQLQHGLGARGGVRGRTGALQAHKGRANRVRPNQGSRVCKRELKGELFKSSMPVPRSGFHYPSNQVGPPGKDAHHWPVQPRATHARAKKTPDQKHPQNHTRHARHKPPDRPTQDRARMPAHAQLQACAERAVRKVHPTRTHAHICGWARMKLRRQAYLRHEVFEGDAGAGGPLVRVQVQGAQQADGHRQRARLWWVSRGVRLITCLIGCDR